MNEKSGSAERAKRISTIVFDVDGVLTDGGMMIDSAGGETKRFHVKDGTGIKYLQRSGLVVAIISGRESAAVRLRAGELGIEHVYLGYKVKLEAYDELKRALSVSDAEIAYMGDDLPDVPVMRISGLAVTVADACAEVRGIAHLVTDAAGGYGAAREFAEWFLKSTGRWESILRRYFPAGEGEIVD